MLRSSIKSSDNAITPLLLLIREVLVKQHDLTGDEREWILWFTGCAQAERPFQGTASV